MTESLFMVRALRAPFATGRWCWLYLGKVQALFCGLKVWREFLLGAALPFAGSTLQFWPCPYTRRRNIECRFLVLCFLRAPEFVMK